MTLETQAKIDDLGQALQRLNAAIGALEQERETVVGRDPAYAEYVRRYRVQYKDEPLSIQRFYELSEEYESVLRVYDAVYRMGRSLAPVDQRYRDRLMYLERVLAV
jgi:hypothetical protein